jgi:hypothetical protein
MVGMGGTNLLSVKSFRRYAFIAPAGNLAESLAGGQSNESKSG